MNLYHRFVIVLTVLALVGVGWPNVRPTPARAAGPWYVAPSGNDGDDCLSALTSCATINGAIGKATAGDTIYVATGTYTNSAGSEVVLIDKDITLSGGWDNSFTTQSGMSAIDGGGARRGITVNGNITVIVDRFVVQNGYLSYSGFGGGGIYNGGTLTLNNSTVSGNTSSGYAGGGGIFNAGALTLNNSTVSGNTSSGAGGGGIYNGGTLTLTNSTVSGNSSWTDGGGISNGGALTLTNSTVSGNSSSKYGGGGIINQGTLTLNNSTISGNSSLEYGGGIYNYGTLTLQNSILAGNAASGAGPDCSGSISSSGYNLIGNTSGCTFTPGVGDLTNINANLGQLISSPAYYPLLSDSPAINAGNPTGCMGSTGLLTTDQRGAARVGICDIGAYEYTPPGPAARVSALSGTPQSAAPLDAFGLPLSAAVLDSLGSPVSNTVVTFAAPASGASGAFADSGTFTTAVMTNESGVVTAATFTANGTAGSYLVTTTASGVITPAAYSLRNVAWYVAPGGSDSDDCLSPSTPCASLNGAISKAAPSDTIKVATGIYTSLAGTEVVSVTKSINLSGGWDATFTMQSGMSTIDGGGTRRGLTVNGFIPVVIQRFVIQNGNDPEGGGIYNGYGTLTVNNSTISGNTASVGGGIDNGGTLTLNNSTVSGNTGGGIYNTFTLTLNNSTVSGNSNQGDGGGIYNNNYGTLTLNNSTVSGNTSSAFGGGIYNSGGMLTLNNSTVSGNTAYALGGIDNYYGTLTLNNSTVSGNTDRGIYNGGTLTLNNSTVSGNTGGGIDISNGTLTLNNSTVSGNTGVGISSYYSTLTLNNSTVSGNSGGGSISTEGTLTLRNSILAGNAASGAGPDCAGTISSAGYNLIGNTTGCTFNATTGDLLNIDPKLWFALTGTPGVQPLLPGSPAIDAGNPSGCEDNLGNPLLTDQRGMARVGRCDIGAFEFDPNNNPITQIFLPVIRRPKARVGINGTVTENGAPAPGVSLDLRFYNGSSWSTLTSTTTDADGDYFFTGIPSLNPGQYYYVRYQNTSSGNPNRLWTWHTQSLSAYIAGSNVSIGNFDLANITLISPADGATVNVPQTFQWMPRPATPTDNYEFDLYDPFTFDPYIYPVVGYVGSYTLNSLPPGFNVGNLYVWELWVYSPDGGFGISYESRVVFFSNTGIVESTVEQLIEPIRPDDVHHPQARHTEVPVKRDVWRRDDPLAP